MKQSGNYWKERFRQLEEAQNNISVSKTREIQEQFEKAQAAINGKIDAWYQRFAANNGISMAEARRMLSAQELKEFQWNVEDYIKYGKENAVSQAWEKQLENASARVHISRLESLKLEVQQELERMYGNYLDSVDRHIKDIYTSDFYHSAYEIQKGVGIGSSLQRLDSDVVEKIVSKPWAVDGKNFSDRIWENKTKLINQVHNSLSVMCITGEAPDRAIQEIAKNMNVSRSQADRLVMTESAAFAGKARADCMKSLGVEEFEVVESLDHITCDYCQSMDGKHFPMGDFQIGVTAPPFHPNCRGSTCPYFDDEFTIGEERAARGEDGKVYYVPSDMTYEEWEKSFVDSKEKRTGSRTVIDWLKRDDKAEEYYNSIRKSNSDIDRIAQNTGFSKEDIMAIKEHVFFNSHIFDNEIGKFDADYDMAVAWQRLINGNYEERDIVLLYHELLESEVEKKYNLTYREAHKIAEEKYAWDKIIDDLFGGDGENVSLDELIKNK